MATNKKVVILIITHKPKLTAYEVISIEQCFSVLGQYPIYFVCPEGLDVCFYQEKFPEAQFHFIHPYWQKSYENFAKLKMNPLLYEQYSDYEYVFFYEADAFVFKDELAYWCDKGYSYLGAPWFEGLSDANEDAPFLGIGNGGFSLRKVEDHLKAITHHKKIFQSKDWSRFLAKGDSAIVQTTKFLYRFLVGNSTHYRFNNFQRGEDRFWGLYVSRAYDWFTVPTEEVARRFSIETLPQRLIKENNGELPFGCHAWWRYDLSFWKPHIESYGYDLDVEMDQSVLNRHSNL